MAARNGPLTLSLLLVMAHSETSNLQLHLPRLSTARSETLGAYMNEGDLFGYFAAFLVFATFYMKRMIPLRLKRVTTTILRVGAVRP